MSITMQEAEDIFINGLREHLSDSNVLDINEDAIGVRASKSYWIDKGWSTDESSGLEGQSRWATWGLPQVQLFTIQTTKDAEGVEGEQYWNATLQLDIFASGSSEKNRLAGQSRDLFKKDSRKSMSASGLKVDSIINDFDSIADERIPQGVYRRTLTFRVFYRTDRG